MLHFMFDQGGLVGKIPGWDWADALSWCGVCVAPILMSICVLMCAVTRSILCLVKQLTSL